MKKKGPRKNITFRTTRVQWKRIKELAKQAGLPANEWMTRELEKCVTKDEQELGRSS